MSAETPMRLDRRMAVRAMENMGWSAKRVMTGRTAVWHFTRPDTGGFHDLLKCRQDLLSMRFVAESAMRYGDANDLKDGIDKLKEKWLRERFFGIYKRMEESADES